MSIKDEIEKIQKERSDASTQYKIDAEKTRAILIRKLDSAFSNLSLLMYSQNQLLIETLISVNAINVLKELRKEYNLIYSKERRSQAKKNLWGKVNYITEESVIPAKLMLYLNGASQDFKFNYKTKEGMRPAYPLSNRDNYPFIDCSQTLSLDTVADWRSSITDYETWDVYRTWSKDITSEWRKIDDFSKLASDLENTVNDLKASPLKSIYAHLDWDYRSDFDRINDCEVNSYCHISVNITPENVEVIGGRNVKSTPINGCTENWVRQQIAVAYLNNCRI